MAKGQRRSSKEPRKPKANPPKKNNMSNPSTKPQGLSAVASTFSNAEFAHA